MNLSYLSDLIRLWMESNFRHLWKIGQRLQDENDTKECEYWKNRSKGTFIPVKCAMMFGLKLAVCQDRRVSRAWKNPSEISQLCRYWATSTAKIRQFCWSVTTTWCWVSKTTWHKHQNPWIAWQIILKLNCTAHAAWGFALPKPWASDVVLHSSFHPFPYSVMRFMGWDSGDPLTCMLEVFTRRRKERVVFVAELSSCKQKQIFVFLLFFLLLGWFWGSLGFFFS